MRDWRYIFKKNKSGDGGIEGWLPVSAAGEWSLHRERGRREGVCWSYDISPRWLGQR